MLNQILEYLPLFTLVIGALTAYFGAKSAVLVSVARLEERMKALEERQKSDHGKLEEIEALIRK